MKTIIQLTLGVVAAAAVTHASSQVLLDDTWADGSRTEQNLPAESAWYAASSSTLTASPGLLQGTSSGSALWVTYFTDGTPMTLGIGDQITALLSFTPRNVVVDPTTTRGLRVGLFDWSAGTRLSADGFSTGSSGANGENVEGYMLNMNFATTLTTDNPMQLMERTDIASANLMGSTSQYTSLGSGPSGVSGNPAFADDTLYTLALTIARTGADTVDFTAAIDGGSFNISHMVTDASDTTFSFDTFAIRPNGASSSAEFWDISNVRVTVVPEPSIPVLAGLGLLGLFACRLCQRRRT